MRKFNFMKGALTLALGCAAFFAQAADVYVSATGDDGNDGTQAQPVLTLRKAYDLINSASGTIYVSGEIDGYSNPVNTDAVCPFLGNPYTLTIQGVEGTNPKIVGNSTVRMFRLRSDMGLILKDLTLSGTVGETATIDGCCVMMQGGWLETDNVIFENFSNNNNGAVLCVNAISAAKPSLICKNSVFRNNSGGTAGYGSVMRVNDVAVTDTKFYFENCAFVNNSALYGTFFFRQATVVETNPSYTYVNCTFTGNTNSNGNSGCLTAYSAPITVNVINCTVKDNPTNGSVRATAAATVNVYNSILEGNNGFDLNCDNNPVVTVRNSLILAKRNVPDEVYVKPANYTATGQLLDAFDAETNTFTPKFASLAIGYGDKQYLENLGVDGATTINYDQLGNTRSFENNTVDAGAVEVGESAIYVSSEGNDDNTGTENLPVLTLKKAFSFFAANQTGTIYVSGNVAADTEGNGLDLNGVNLKIEGVEGTNAGVTGDSVRIFNVRNNAVLTLKNLHLSGNPEKSLVGQGGCIAFAGGGALFAENVTFENFSTAIDPEKIASPNTDTNAGGLIYLNQFNASSANPILSFKQCLFKNNSTTGSWGGGAIHVRDFGTPANPQVYFENCGFYGNTADVLTGGGGSVITIRGGAAAASTVSFVNSTITACGTGGQGAIVYSSGGITLNVINSTIKDNPVSGIMCWEQGTPTLNIYNSIIENNAGTNMNDVRFSDKTENEATININNSLIGNPLWRNIATAPYTKPAEYTVGTLFEALDEASISFKPSAGSLALNYGDAQYLTALNINYDQLGHERLFENDQCDAGAIEAIKNIRFTGTGAWSEAARWNTGAVPAAADVVSIDGDATIDSNVEIAVAIINEGKSLSVAAGNQFTVSDSLAIDGVLNLQSDAAAAATILTAKVGGNGTANVEQYLSTENGRTWYYLASPVSGATSELFGEEDKVGHYDEATTSWTAPYETPTTLTAGKGYLVQLAADVENPVYTFSGTLNSGDIAIPVTRTGTENAKRGFNLVGNPYPSYLDWNAVESENVQSTLWTRTFETGNMVFKTYNADAQIGVDDETTAHIAPLQAFWVKVPADKADVADLTLLFTDALRLHKADGAAALRASEAEDRPLIRLQISNGTVSDKALILFDENAQNGFDSYDSEKMSNDNPVLPEIYTTVDEEQLAINSFSAVSGDLEIPVGISIGTAGTYSISASQISRIDELPVVLRDHATNAEFDLKTNGSYEFTSEVADNDAARFTLAFTTRTGIENVSGFGFTVSGANGNITIKLSGLGNQTDLKAGIFDVTGRKLHEETLNRSSSIINRSFNAGVYLVKIGNKTAKVAVK
ncbi:MAG: T9SS type A sorting domain-containing protein [Dysgonamonadaceae bacterium]|jgi:hypothetical protein|nr:T9SS type A sorting domain-containing protein [Dysgonamonadaceae bacterium]